MNETDSAEVCFAETETKVKENKVLNLDTLFDRKAQVAEQIGVSPTEIRTVTMQLESLRKQGILVDLNISGTSMFTRATKWVEIGIQPDENDVRVQRFTRGRKYIIPEEEIKKLHSVETSMRNALDYYGQEITGFRPYRWIPFTAYPQWRIKWAELLERFNSVKASIIARREEFVEDLKEDFAQVADASWASIRKQGYEYVIMNGKIYVEHSFKTIVIEDALAKMPTAEEIEKNLKADYITAMVYGMEDLEADHAKAEAIVTEAKAQKVKAQIEQQMAYDQLEHSKKMQELEEQEREAKIEAMWKAEIEHARGQLTTIVSPFEEVFKNLRNRFAQDASEMLESVKKNGFVRGKVAEKGRGLVDLYDLFATHDDKELRAKLSQLRQAIGADAKERDDNAPQRSTNEIASILEQISDLSHNAVQDLSAGPSRFSMIE